MFIKHQFVKYTIFVVSVIFGLVFWGDNTFAYEAAITTSGAISLDIMSMGSRAAVTTDDVKVTSTCPSGYTLSIAATSSTNSTFSDTTLYKSGDNTNSNKIITSSGTVGSPATITDDNLGTWGYSTTSNTSSGTFIGLTNEFAIVATKDAPSDDGGDNIPVYYGASAPASLEPGLYKMSDNAVITYYLTTSPECARYTIAYDNNNANAGTMGIQTTDDNGDELADNSEVTLSPSNFSRAGYGFAGWSLVELNPDSASFSTDLQAAITAGQVFGPQETIALDSVVASEADRNSVITMHAIWIKAEVGTTLQTWNGCSAMTAASYTGDIDNQEVWSITASANSFVALADERDGEVYTIARLTDGKCWMVENFRLTNAHQEGNTTAPTALTLSNTNHPLNDGTNVVLKHNYSDTTTYNTLSATSSDATSWCTADSAACNDQSRIYTNNTMNRASYTSTQNMDTNANIYSYGVYYNWYSATAGTGTYSVTSGGASGDLCPAGWHLPNGTGLGDFGVLSNSLGGRHDNDNTAMAMTDSTTPTRVVMTKRARHFPNNFISSGYIWGESLYDLGSNGFYWTNTAINNKHSQMLMFSPMGFSPGSANTNKYSGRSIRCVASTDYTVTFDANGGTGTMNSQTISSGMATNLASNSFTRTGYDFAGWNTKADGTGTSYTNGEGVTNLALPGRTITLYAQWQKGCTANNICYFDNGANSPTQMGDQAVQSGAETVMLWASNYQRSNYGFAGWNTKTDGTGTNYGPNQIIDDASTINTIGSNGLKLYAIWKDVAKSSNGSELTFQTSNLLTTTLAGGGTLSSKPNGYVTALKDSRDNQVYAVAKLADGNYWMIENLRTNSSSTLSTSNTNNPGLPLNNAWYISSSSYSTLTTSNHLSATSSTWCSEINANCIDQSLVDTLNTTSPVSNMTSTSNRAYSYGNYYNWYSATAGRGTYSVNSGNVQGDICPAGWHIPYGGSGTSTGGGKTSGGFGYLDIQLGGTGQYSPTSTSAPEWRKYPNNFISAGQRSSNTSNSRGWYSAYWTSTTKTISTDPGAAYWMEASTSTGFTASATNSSGKTYGSTIRCIKNS